MQFRIESRNYYSGQQDLTLLAFEGKTVFGHIDYSKYEDQISIQMIDVPAEMRRKGIGTALLKRLQKEYPDTEIEWGGTTDDGSELYNRTKFVDVPTKGYAAKAKRLEQLQRLEQSYKRLMSQLSTMPPAEREQRRQTLMPLIGPRWNKINDLMQRYTDELNYFKPSKRLIKTD